MIRILNIILIILLLPNFVKAKQIKENASISIHACDLFGMPLPEATVEIVKSGTGLSIKSIIGATGYYKADSLQGGQYKITVTSQGFRSEDRIVFLKSQEVLELELGLEPGQLHDPFPVQINGVVLSTGKLKIKNAIVVIENIFNRRLRRVVTTNIQGEYKITVDNPGQYILYAISPDYIAAVHAVTLLPVLPRIHLTIDLTLKKYTDMK